MKTKTNIQSTLPKPHALVMRLNLPDRAGLPARMLRALLGTCALLLAAFPALSATLTYDFGGGLQGWTQLGGPTIRNAWNSGGNAWGATANGSIYGYDGDDTYDVTYWVRSPVFQLDGSGPLTVHLWGGLSHAACAANESLVPPDAQNNSGFKGVALREVATGNFVKTLSLTSGGQNMDLSLSVADLAPYANNGKMYTLDFLDYDYGGWGWVGMDNVTIPGILMEATLTPVFQALTIGSNASVVVSIPNNFNAVSPVTVYVTNSNPAALTINGSSDALTTVVFATGGASSQILTLAGAGLGTAHLTTGSGLLASKTASIAVLSPSGLVGRWLTGEQDLLDKSGYTPAGTHDGALAGGFVTTPYFSADIPPGAPALAMSLDLSATSGAIIISNTVATEPGYRATFDDGTAMQLSVVFWAKGLPGGWNPFVSKNGEGSGWQVRKRADQPVAAFTLRGTPGDADPFGGSTFIDDGNWHQFAATWDGIAGVRRLYVDGKLNNLVSHDAGPMTPANGTYLTLGGRCGAGSSIPGNLLIGQLFDVQIYGVALSGSAVQSLFSGNTGALAAYADNPVIDVSRSGSFSVSIPAGANASSAVTVFVTNTAPAVVSLAGSVANVATLTFPAGGGNSQTITLTGLSEGQAQLACAATGLTGASATVKVYGPHLVGHWFTGAENYSDSSAFAPSGTHDGAEVGATGTLTFSTDTPPSKPGKAAQFGGGVGLLITNTSLLDGAYLPTFDDLVANRLSFAFWAKGVPGNWNPFAAKRGEDGIGWQLRRHGTDKGAAFTIRGTPGDDDPQGALAIDDGQWHHFAAVWDGVAGTRKLFVDGTLDPNINLANDFAPMTAAPNHHFMLGAREQSAVTNAPLFEGFFSGLLYDVRVYNYPLSLVEVSNLSFVAAIKLTPAQRSLQAPQTMTVDVVLPAGANQSQAVTVQVTNQTPALASLVGAVGNVLTLTYPIGGSLTQQVTVAGITDGKAQLKATGGGFATGTGTFSVWSDPGSKLIGHWLSGAANLNESSGFRPAGKHNGVAVGASANSLAFSTDVPTIAPTGSQSLDLSAGNVAVMITNSATTDGDYVETFDGQMQNKFTIAFWAKGAFTADWNPWVSKRGEGSLGYQVRRHGGDYPVKPAFTLRGTPGDDDPYSNITVDDVSWHHYVATWDGTAGIRTLYVDGVRGLVVGNDTGPMGLATGDHFMIGARDSGGIGNFFPGLFYDVRVYSYALSAAEAGVLFAPPSAFSLSLVRTNIALGSTAQLTVMLPATATVTSPVTVYLTNNSPSVVTIVGSTGNVFAVTFPVGSQLQVVNLQAIGLGQVDITAEAAGLGTAALTSVNMVYAPQLVGHWLGGAADLLETSGYRPAGTHDGQAIGANAAALAFASDVPGGFSGQSLDLRAGNVGVMVNNSANLDGSYLPTFDDEIAANFTVAFWAKGMPSDWYPWVSKRGEDGIGWQLRRMGGDPVSGFTVRGVDNEDGWGSSINVNDAPPKWHHFAGVWDQFTGTRALYVDGVLSHFVYNNPVQALSQAPGKHLALGAREGGGTDFEGYFSGLLYDVRVYNYSLTSQQVAAVANPPAQPVLSVKAWTGQQVRIAWPSAFTGYSLQQSSTASGGWGASGLTITVEGPENVAYAPTPTSQQYFRLKK